LAGAVHSHVASPASIPKSKGRQPGSSRPFLQTKMTLRKIQLNFEREGGHYEIVVGNGILGSAGAWAVGVLGSRRKLAIISNPTVFGLYGESAVSSLASAGFEVSRFLMPDGEEFKDLHNAESALDFLNEQRITRGDAVVSLGGGVVGDLAGFAASVHLRGVDFLQIPTTLLAMIDSSVGGKTGVNSSYGKNLIGSFHQPKGVLADVAVLKTLDSREIAAGFYEAVKQAALSGKPALEDLKSFLLDVSSNDIAAYLGDSAIAERLCELVETQVRFKATVVSGDTKETVSRNDRL
jgi:3-dehydroquinate synthetase